MKNTEAIRIDDKAPLVVDDDAYALIKSIEELTKAIETLARITGIK